MSDISKEELKKEIAAILKDADLGSITSKKVRQDIEKKLDIDLASRRKEVDELVMDYIDKDKGKKKNGNVEDDDDDDDEDDDNEEEEEDDEEEEEEVKKPKRGSTKKAPPAKRYKSASSDESDDASSGEGDDDYSPKKKVTKKAAPKRGAGKKKKGGSDDDSDEDWGKGKKRGGGAAKKAGGAKRGGGSGYTKAITLSPELAAVVGETQMARHEVVKRIWAIIKERNLYDPSNKQFAICDDELLKVFGVKRFRTFGMMKFLKNHFRA